MLQVGQTLHDRYQLKRLLGQNAGRQTWLADDRGTQPSELVVVKLLSIGDQLQWDNLKLFEREVNVLKQLDHSRIPRYRDYFSIEDRNYWFGLVQDYIPGASLKALLAQGRNFSEVQVRQIAISVLEILVYLHGRSPPVLHRDIKPSNLIRGENNQIYLVDFGAVQDSSTFEGATVTIVGTYGYAPLEQFGGRAAPASDLYALGATLIHLLTRVAPGDLPQQNLRLQFRDRVRASDSIVQWIEALTEPDVERRINTAGLALEALNNPIALKAASPIQKPYGSRVQLRKSANQLEITLPMRGVQPSDAFLVFFLIIWYGFTIPLGREAFPVILIFWLAGLLPLSTFMFPAFGAVHLWFNRNLFVLEWKLMGFPYRKIQGKTSAIHAIRVNQESIQVNARPLIGIVLQAGAREYTFGAFAPDLADVERDWLMREIKDWLRLKD